ncbi:hypothetical protein JCM16303_005432 [Sporobolomyces ruberrimus]
MSQERWGGFGVLRPERPPQRPALLPQPVPKVIHQYPQGYQGFLDVLNRAVTRWGPNKRYNEDLWSPLAWREAWLRIITPDWWEIRLKGGRPSIKAIMTTLDIESNANIHDGDFPSVERAIKNGLDPATVSHEGSSESWLRSLTVSTPDCSSQFRPTQPLSRRLRRAKSIPGAKRKPATYARTRQACRIMAISPTMLWATWFKHVLESRLGIT